ncbi:2-oxoglutarate (2OG) and Fe(II)-dependent oxygenase superfamily protein [Euphorbia peplus]|nr:2-oxoglutarate (2OG) and Fe(II)-dependent oxygenase superfamily protein [Euphorbia peplus]
MNSKSDSDYSRMNELKAFDNTKEGVKGLVDAGITHIPHLSGVDKDSTQHTEVVEQLRKASETWGFFQVINHGIPGNVLEEMKEGVRRFHEQDSEIKKAFYTRDITKKVGYNSNFDLYSAPSTNWRNSLVLQFAPDPINPEQLSTICRDIFMEYSKQVVLRDFFLLGHYYPACPQPELTFGTTQRADNDFLTILLQDQIGGLQVLHQNQWIDVPPAIGALVVNIGDLLQLISNDQLISLEHRVLANRIGPRYRETTVKEFTPNFFAKGLDGTSALLHFKL